jgi:FkbM family methyltransferase
MYQRKGNPCIAKNDTWIERTCKMATLSIEVRRKGWAGRLKLILLELLAPFSPTIRKRRNHRRALMARWSEKCAAVERFEALLKTIGPGHICLDIGANVGKITQLFAETGATVHAFEPDPWAFKQLTIAMQDFNNVKLYNVAIGTESRTVFLTRQDHFDVNPRRASTGSTITKEDGKISVEQYNLVDFIQALNNPIKIAKMDIEGAEIDVCNHLFSHPVLDQIENLFVETHEFRPHHAAATAALRASIPQHKKSSISLDWI